MQLYYVKISWFFITGLKMLKHCAGLTKHIYKPESQLTKPSSWRMSAAVRIQHLPRNAFVPASFSFLKLECGNIFFKIIRGDTFWVGFLIGKLNYIRKDNSLEWKSPSQPWLQKKSEECRQKTKQHRIYNHLILCLWRNFKVWENA